MSLSEKSVNNCFWFIPVRRGCNEAQILVEAGSLDEAVSRVKAMPDYITHYNDLPLNRKHHGYIELESDFMKSLRRVSERTPEQIFGCENRIGRNLRQGCLCSKIKEHKEPLCIIHQSYFKFELPKDCPYLLKDSKYVSFFTEDGLD